MPCRIGNSTSACLVREVARCRFFGRNLFPRKQAREGGEQIRRRHSHSKGYMEQDDVRRHQEFVESVYSKETCAISIRLPSQLSHCRGEIPIRIKPLWDWGEGGGYWVRKATKSSPAECHLCLFIILHLFLRNSSQNTPKKLQSSVHARRFRSYNTEPPHTDSF